MKRKKLIRILITILVIILVFFMAVMPFLSYIVYASDSREAVTESTVSVGENLSLTSGVYENTLADDRLTENYLLYEPGGDIEPLVVYGHDIYQAASLKKAAGYAEEETGSRVMAAVNGDFFMVSTGVSVGLVVREGTLRTSDDGTRYALMFDKDGNASIGVSELSITVSSDSFSQDLTGVHLNKVLSANSGVVLFDRNFNDTNRNSAMKHSYYLTVKSGEMQVGGTLVCEVESVRNEKTADPLDEDHLVLSIQDDTSALQQYEEILKLEVGSEITIAIEGSEELENAVNAVGGGDLLIEDGESCAPEGSTRAPRTAVGIRENGEVIFYTVDGRQENYSIGMTYKELAERLLELGCVRALNLDGGGSTTMEVVYPGDLSLSLVNSPSGGSLRSCANYILFVTDKATNGTLKHLHVYPNSETVLAGSSFTYEVKGTDSAYYPVTVSQKSVSYRTSEIGEIYGNTFTAGSEAGKGTVTASLNGIKGTGTVIVVTEVDTVVLTSEAAGTEVSQITLSAGDSVDLSAEALIKKVKIRSSDESFTWECTEGIGTIDETGLFTAANLTGTGTITVSVGDVKATAEVKVVSEGTLIADFEEGQDATRYYEERAGAGIESKLMSDNRALVRFGQQSLELDYNFNYTEDGLEAYYPINARITGTATQMNFWVYGDNSGNALGVEFGVSDGLEVVGATLLNFTGWKQVYLDVPEGAKTVTNLVMYPSSETGVDEGTLYIDQLVISRGDYSDHTAPEISLTVEGRTLTGILSDDMDGHISASDVKVTYDGEELDFVYSVEGQSFTADLPEADCYDHQVAVQAHDLSGNMTRKFLTMPAEQKDETDAGEEESGSVYAVEIPFTDTEGHWSESYANYLYQQGLTSGSTDEKGNLVYRPNDCMTRQEIAVMLARWLGVVGEYDDVELPYDDLDEIAAWALPSVKAMYALGIINGTSRVDITGEYLEFNPKGELSREGIMTMLGRIQDKGYPESDMDFTDADKVSSWALPYVRSLVGQGIIKGADGLLRPLDPVTRGEAAKILCCLY